VSRPITTRATVAGAAVLALTLAGCGADGGQVTDPAPDTAAYPVVAVGQASSVLNAVQAALVRGVTAKQTATTVDARLVGPFRDLALADARIAAEQKQAVTKPATLQGLRLIVTTNVGWPRYFIAVGNSSQASTPVLRVLSSASPRTPYGLWAEPSMLPGATLPETAAESTGSALVAADADGFVASPKEVLSGFAGYLNAGAKTSSSRQFQRSIYSDQLLQQLAADRKGLKAVATVSSKHVVAAGEPLALRTADGGALVIGELEQTYVIRIKKGKGKVKVTDKRLAALAGGTAQIRKTLTRTAVEVVVFHVPARGTGLITVVAAQKGDVQAVIR
jgi:hypothetical protein